MRLSRVQGRARLRGHARRRAAKLSRLLKAVGPFVDLIEPQFDDPPFTDEDFTRLDVHMFLIGDGELGDIRLSAFRDLRDAAKAFA